MPPEQNQSQSTVQSEPKGNGAFVGSIIIVIILIVGGIYLWMTKLNKDTLPTESPSDTTASTDAQLEADINSVDLESLDSEI